LKQPVNVLPMWLTLVGLPTVGGGLSRLEPRSTAFAMVGLKAPLIGFRFACAGPQHANGRIRFGAADV
jgi:hypothetical protein